MKILNEFYVLVVYYMRNLMINVPRFFIRFYWQCFGYRLKYAYLIGRYGKNVTERYYRMTNYKYKHWYQDLYKKNTEIIAIMSDEMCIPQYKLLGIFDIENKAIKYTDKNGTIHCFCENAK